MQRYHRLKQEVGELLADVAQITEAQRSSEKMLEVSPVDLAQDVSPGPTSTGWNRYLIPGSSLCPAVS